MGLVLIVLGGVCAILLWEPSYLTNHWRHWVSPFALLLALAAFPGCAANGEHSVRDALLILERGNAVGHVTLSSSGSPLAAGQTTTFFLGPAIHFAFDGDIRFDGEQVTSIGPVVE